MLEICAEKWLFNFKKIIIEQPVKYDNKSFIRLALGSYVRMLMQMILILSLIKIELKKLYC